MSRIDARFLVLALFLMGLFSTPTVAQQATVRGFVADASSEEAMQGASVALLQDGVIAQGSISDADGYFLLNRIRPGQYVIRISFIGFQTYVETIELASGAVFERSVTLIPTETAIGEVVIVGELAGGVTTVAAGLESVVPADIAKVPVPGVSGDLASFMQTLPGVVVQGDRGGQFFVRGGSVDQNLAFMDGLPVYLPFHILSFYSAFPEGVVNRADVFTGGYGARYGSRISSMIDVHARNGNKQNLAGTIGLAPFLSEVRIEGPIVKNRVSAILNVRQSLIKDLFPELLGQKMPYQFGDRFGKIHALLGRSHSLSVMFLDTEDSGDIAGTKKTFQGETIPFSSTDSTEVSWENRVFGGTYEFRSNQWPLVFRLAAGRSTMSNHVGPPNAPLRKSGIESVDVSADLSWLFRSGSIDAGFSRRKSTLSYELDGIFENYTTSSEDVTEVSAFLQTSLWLGRDRLNLNPGVHLYTLSGRSRSWIEPRFRISWYPQGSTSRFSMHAAAGLYHQAVVGLNDERDLGAQFTAWTITPDDADIPSARHAILGGSYQVVPWLSVAVEGFYKAYDELSVPIFSSFPRFTTALQTADGAAQGVDVRLDMTNRPFVGTSTLKGYVTYAYSNVEYDAGAVTYHPSHDRTHQINALITSELDVVSITVQFQAGSGLPYTQSSGFDKWYLLTPDVDVTTEPGQDRILYADPYEGRQPTYSRLDLWLERRIENGRYVATLRAGIVNVLNRSNLFYFDLFEFRRVDQLPLIPSVGVKLELR